MTKPPIYVINLDDHRDRWLAVKRQLDALGLACEHLSAVDLRAASPQQIQGHRANAFGYIKRHLTPGEIGCFLSHRAAWEKIAASGARGGFILEDDIFLSLAAKAFLGDDDWIPSTLQACQLSLFKTSPEDESVRCAVLKMHPAIVNPTELQSQFRLSVVLSPVPWGTQGYWISAKAAAYALRDTKDLRFDRPVDDYLFLQCARFSDHNRVASLRPAVIWESGEFVSSIGNRHAEMLRDAKLTLLEKIRRKIHRFRLKHLMRRFSEEEVHVFCEAPVSDALGEPDSVRQPVRQSRQSQKPLTS